jgi:methylene-fatty-acyl-phospholipid synthase
MSLRMFAVAAVLLSIERICYVWAWRYPESFGRFCSLRVVSGLGGPVAVLQRLFVWFKVIQVGVFIGWFLSYGSLWPLVPSGVFRPAGIALIVVGQILNLTVFHRLGKVGVFYGSRFGYHIPWCTAFPFSLFRHPQYVGVLCSVWGLFLAVSFPRYGWFVLPSVESVYYVLGAWLEQ